MGAGLKFRHRAEHLFPQLWLTDVCGLTSVADTVADICGLRLAGSRKLTSRKFKTGLAGSELDPRKPSDRALLSKSGARWFTNHHFLTTSQSQLLVLATQSQPRFSKTSPPRQDKTDKAFMSFPQTDKAFMSFPQTDKARSLYSTTLTWIMER